MTKKRFVNVGVWAICLLLTVILPFILGRRVAKQDVASKIPGHTFIGSEANIDWYLEDATGDSIPCFVLSKGPARVRVSPTTDLVIEGSDE